MDVLLKLLFENNIINEEINMQRPLDMYLRTKFAKFKHEGYINNSKNGPRYTLESLGQDLLSK